MENETAAVIAAAGQGLRCNSRQKKQYISVLGHPVIAWTVDAFYRTGCIDRILIVAPEDDIPFVRDSLLGGYRFSASLIYVTGGVTRQESVFNGITALPDSVKWVAVHDGVRMTITPDIISRVCRTAQIHGAALAAVRATDSMFVADDDRIKTYLDRDVLWQAQTPQVFDRTKIVKAFEQAKKDSFAAGDDAMVYRRYEGNVHVVEGSRDNIKVTYPADLEHAETILKNRHEYPQ